MRGPMGIPGIPAVSLFGHPLTEKWEWVLLAGFFYALVFGVAHNFKRSALGRILVGISEDEIFCQSLGKNVGLAKLQSFVLGAMLAAVPGALYAHYVSYIDPTSFTIHESIFVLSIIIVGGMGNLWGSLAAAAFMILVPDGHGLCPFPLLNPLPEGEEANERLREFYDNACASSACPAASPPTCGKCCMGPH